MDWWDKVVGTTVAVLDNITGIDLRDDYTPTDASDYNTAQDLGDVASILMGINEAGSGTALAAGSVAVTGGTGGLSIEVTGPSFALGSAMAAHGTFMANSGANNFASQKGRYSNVPDPKNAGEGKKFTPSQKQKIIEENKARNNGQIKSDLSGKHLDSPQKMEKGQKANMNQAEVDHVDPKSKGGTNKSSNAQVLSKEENLKKGNR